MTTDLRGTNLPVTKTNLRDQNHFYLKIGKDGNQIQMLEKDFVPLPGYNYRIVHNLVAASTLHHGNQLFVDNQFTIDVEKQFPGEQILVKRLSNLYGVTNKLSTFFDLGSKPTELDNFATFDHQKKQKIVPHCIRQLALFQTNHYKSLFISQQFTETGKYILTANINGRFEVISVDDRVPIYKKTLEPIWGLRFENPWEMILLKAWAKIKGGYDQVANSKPFEFIEAFSNSTWKYFNLLKEPQKFMKHYYANNKFKNGKIILKTKKDQAISADGILPDSACYQLIGLYERKLDESMGGRGYLVVVRTTEQVKWSHGQYTFYRPSISSVIDNFSEFSLDHDMFMTEKEFLKYFVAAYITSTRHEDYYTGYKILDILKNERKAQHLQFVVPEQGFFDFSVIQSDQNKMVNVSAESRISFNDIKSNISFQSNISQNDVKRYLRIKYILVRDSFYVSKSEEKKEMAGKEGSETSKVRAIKGLNSQYIAPRFTTYEIQYFKGYRKGEAHFVKLDPGRYILRVKSEKADQNARYAVNWTCSHQIDLNPAKLSRQEQIDIIQDSMISILHKFPHFCFDRQSKTEMITIANSFEEIGYAFVGVKCAYNCQRSIIIEVDPKKLDEDGYRLKGKFKEHSDSMQPFAVKIDKGEYNSIVFKKKKNVTNFVWPPTAFNVYKKDLKGDNQLNVDPNMYRMSGRQSGFQPYTNTSL